MNAIDINGLEFSYSKNENLLQNLNMNVPQGSIYGFLGPNGAGKTTTLKLILSLLKNKSRGKIFVLGNDISSDYPNYLSNIGSLIEEPSIYGHLTAKENLKLWTNYHMLDGNRSEEVLSIVGLTHASNKKVSKFSTGMKQRLGLGVALIHDPEILILDEPTNGLDPMGINELRTLLISLRNKGKTILLSSHILSEVEKLVDYVGIIKNGTIVFEGTLEALNDIVILESNITIVVDDCIIANEVLEPHFSSQIIDNQLSIAISSNNDVNKIVRLLLDNNIQLYEVNLPKKSLETIFMKLAK